MAFDFLKSLDSDDIFISYSRDDGEAYLTGLDAALSNLGFSCFTDKRGTDANQDLPPTLVQKIKLCKTLVLLCTPGALSKPKYITPEVREFADANGTSRIIAVTFDRKTESSATTSVIDWSEVPWFKYVEGKSQEREDPNALKTGEPSPLIVENIRKASDYMKSKDRLRRYRNRALIGFLCIVAAGLAAGAFAAYGFQQARNASNEAHNTRIEADATIAKAKSDVASAVDQAQKDIQKAKEDAQKEIANLAAEKRKLATEIRRTQDKTDATYIRLEVAAFDTRYAIGHIAREFGSKSILEAERGRLDQIKSKLPPSEAEFLQRLARAEKFSRDIADTTLREIKTLSEIISSLSDTAERIVKLELTPLTASTSDGREFKMDDIRTARDPQLLKWFRKASR